MIQFDDRDAEILRERVALWQTRIGKPRVGDFVRMVDGELRRFTYNWGDGLQTTYGGQSGSFYFGGNYMDYSGSLDSAVPIESIRDTGETMDGDAWFFHHGLSGAHRGVTVKVPCRVYQAEV